MAASLPAATNPVIQYVYVYVYEIDGEWHAVSRQREHVHSATPEDALHMWLYLYGPQDGKPVEAHKSRWNHAR